MSDMIQISRNDLEDLISSCVARGIASYHKSNKIRVNADWLTWQEACSMLGGIARTTWNDIVNNPKNKIDKKKIGTGGKTSKALYSRASVQRYVNSLKG